MSVSKKLSNKFKDLDELDFLDSNEGEKAPKESDTHFCGSKVSCAPTHFCCNLECLKVLCPECIDSHSLEHENTSALLEIETLPNVKQKCLRKVKAAISTLTTEVEHTEKIYLQPEDVILQEGQRKLQEARLKLIKFIDNFFEEQEEIFRRRVSENKLKIEDIRKR